MPRLTLILSDLYLPQNSDGPPDRASLQLPNLNWLLRYAKRREVIGDWRTWLALEFGAAALARRPPAQAVAAKYFARLENADDLASRAWLATPVHLEARIDHVRLSDRGFVHLSAAERVDLATDFARHFNPDYSLFDVGSRGFLLVGNRALQARSVDPARLLDMDVGESMPTGQDSGELRRVAAEIEMWLHRTQVNDVRDVAGQRRVSTLWLWGGDSPVHETQLETAGAAMPRDTLTVHGDDPWLGAFAAHVGAGLEAVPMEFRKVDRNRSAVVELNPMTGDRRESLEHVEKHWFGPIRVALTLGKLDSFELVANDLRHRVGTRPDWRFWRRPAPWLARLWHRRPGAKA
jgi:hypothetical protein